MNAVAPSLQQLLVTGAQQRRTVHASRGKGHGPITRLHLSSGLLVDSTERLPSVDDLEQGFIRFTTGTVALRDLQRLPGEQRLVIAPVLRVPQ